MNRAMRIGLASLLGCIFSWIASAAAPEELDRCNVVWNTPSKDASGSMPIGNGEVGLNVWVEENGDLVFYVARSDAWSECCRLLKLGRIRVNLTPTPFSKGQLFRQELVLRDGRIDISAGDAALRVFVDSDAPVVYVVGESKTPRVVTAKLENWRLERRVLKGKELASSWTMQNAPPSIEVWESADAVLPPSGNAVRWHHRNAYSIVPLTLKHQGLESLAHLVQDPLRNRTFGGKIIGGDCPEFRGEAGENRTGPIRFRSVGPDAIQTSASTKRFSLAVIAHASQTDSLDAWSRQVDEIASKIDAEAAARRTAAWWNDFWSRSWIFVKGDAAHAVASKHPLRVGVDSSGGSRFRGSIVGAIAIDRAISDEEIAKMALGKPDESAVEQPADLDLRQGFSVAAWIKPAAGESGRIFDKITAGGQDGFLFDAHPGLALRLIVGADVLAMPNCLKAGEWQHVAASFNAATGVRKIYCNGEVVARSENAPINVTTAYALQRWITACAGRGNYPIKFNGSIFTVDPKFTGEADFNADWRRWGDCYWWQNTRLPYFPMVARGDFDELLPLFRLYRDVLPLCIARAKLYHDARGAYFPETMTIFGTYSNNDYGWNRAGHAPNEVLCPWWQYAWQQGLELATLMLDYYETTEDPKFLVDELIPMAHEVLSYYDTRFKRDAAGKLVISPTQSVETYWHGVVNDTPSVAGLHAVVERLLAIAPEKTPAAERAYWMKLKAALPAVPTITENGKTRITMAEKFKPERSNCENPELYPIWPYRLYGVGRPNLDVGVNTFWGRVEKASFGWQYDGQSAAIVGLADEARRLLLGKIRNANPNHRFPAMWGPNYDWLPDQDHGSNIMLTLQHMLLESAGDKIFVLHAWPKDWDVSFKLHAPRRTVVECVYRGGKVEKLVVTPESRRKDVQLMTQDQ